MSPPVAEGGRWRARCATCGEWIASSGKSAREIVTGWATAHPHPVELKRLLYGHRFLWSDGFPADLLDWLSRHGAHGFTVADIADRFGRKPETVRAALSRLRAKDLVEAVPRPVTTEVTTDALRPGGYTRTGYVNHWRTP